MTGHETLVAAHAVAALVCLLLGGYLLGRRAKGDGPHRAAGRVWAVGMIFVAGSSFAIRELRDGRLSLLHVLSVVTLVTVSIGVVAARRGNVAAHRANMRGSWFGLLGAFVGAVAVPRRLIPTFVVTEPLGALVAGAAVVALTAGVVAVAHVVDRSDRSGAGGPAGAPGGRAAQGASYG